MPVGQLLLMLYLADREAIRERGRPITCDVYASTPLGPLPIHLLRLLTSDGISHPIWRKSVELRGDDVVLLGWPEDRRLSKHDAKVLDGAYESINGLDISATLEKLSVLCPEWLRHLGKLITIREILMELGESEADAEAVARQFAAESRRRARKAA